MKNGSLVILFLVVFIDLLGFGMVIPLIPYYADLYGASATVVGFVVGVYSLMQFLFAPLLGRWSDRIGRRPVLLLSLAGSVAGYAIFAASNSLMLLFVARIVSGVSGASAATARAYVADSTEQADRARGMGLIGAGYGLGFILGPPVGGVLSSFGIDRGLNGNLLPGLAASLLSFIAMTVAFFVLAESRAPSEPTGSARRIPPQFDPQMWRLISSRRDLSLVLGSVFFVFLSLGGLSTAIVLHGKDRFGFTPRDFGYFFGVMGFVGALIQGGLIGRLAGRFGERQLLIGGTLFLAAGYALVPSVYSVAALFVIAVAIAAGQALCVPAQSSLVSIYSPENETGSILGIAASLSSLGRMIGPVLAGYLYDLYVSPGPFYAGTVMVLIASVLVLRTARVGSEAVIA